MDNNLDNMRQLISESIFSHNEEYLAQLMHKNLEEYKELALLVTEGKYTKTWTHLDVLNFVTYGEKITKND